MSKRTYITSLTAVNNSNIVTVNDGTDLTNINPGDDLRIDGLPGEAVKAITATQILLERPWALANKTNVKGINVPTADDFREATKVLRDATVLTSSNMSAVNSWTTKMGTVQFTDPADPTVTYTVKTIRQLEQDAVVIVGSAAEDANRAEAARDAAIAAQNQAEAHKNTAGVSAGNAATKASEAATSASTATTAATTATTKAAEAVVSASNAVSEANRAEVEANKAALAASALYGMPQAQFEAIRAQNNEKYAASGFVHFGKHYHNLTSNYIPINEGLWTNAIAPNNLQLGKSVVPAPLGKSKSDAPVVHIAGTIFTLSMIGISADNQNQIKFPQAPDGKTTYNKSTGVNTNHTTVTAAFNAQAADPTIVEVVTDRVDMWGFEAFLEEVNTTNPYVYPNGLIQSQAVTMDGIATSASARPVTYYAVFDGDTGSKGKGVNFFTLTDAQKKKVLGNHKNNLYYLDDGRLVQWRLRQRTIAGAGNGDWLRVESQKKDNWNFLGFSEVVQATAQGAADTVQSMSNNADGLLIGTLAAGWNRFDHLKRTGAFLAVGRDNQYLFPNAVNGDCYFLVCGTVNRLNQGAYHPSFNPNGASSVVVAAGTAGKWYSHSYLTSKIDCFNFGGSNDIGKVLPVGMEYTSYWSGRPDGRSYDAIYADGQGGVCRDMRYSAYGVDSVDFAEADQRVKNGTYRGFEKQVFTKVIYVDNPAQCTVGAILGKDSQTNGWISGFRNVGQPETINMRGGTVVYVVDGELVVKVHLTGVVEEYSDGTFLARCIFETNSPPAGSISVSTSTYLVIEEIRNTPVGGSFLQTDVIGNPENILATPALANGWQGSWLPTIPDGTNKDIILSRKSLSSTVVREYTTDTGASWYADAALVVINGPLNGSIGLAHGGVQLWHYQAFAKQTENAVNAVVYGGDAGVGNVYAQSLHLPEWGCTFGESLCGIVCKNTVPPEGVTQPLTRYLRNPNGIFNVGNINSPKHAALDIVLVPSNNSPAFKALNYNVNINQQAFIQYAYTELKHNGTNWGDDGKVTIVDNQSSKMDLNGNTVLVGTAKLKEPLGWIKNKV